MVATVTEIEKPEWVEIEGVHEGAQKFLKSIWGSGEISIPQIFFKVDFGRKHKIQ